MLRKLATVFTGAVAGVGAYVIGSNAVSAFQDFTSSAPEWVGLVAALAAVPALVIAFDEGTELIQRAYKATGWGTKYATMLAAVGAGVATATVPVLQNNIPFA